MKTVNACTIEENGSQHNDILKKLDQLDQKYENLTNAISSEEGQGDGTRTV